RPPSNTTSAVAVLPPIGPPAPPQRPEHDPRKPDPVTVKPLFVTRLTPTEKPTTTTTTTTSTAKTTTLAATTAKPTATASKPVTTTTARANVVSLTRAPPVTTPRVAQTPPTRQYLCNATKPEMYLVRVVSSKGSSAGFNQVRDILKREFNRSVELQFLRTPSSFAFRAVSGPLIFTAASVLNALRLHPLRAGAAGTAGAPVIPGVSPLYAVPDIGHQVSKHLRKLSEVEFSFYLGFPTLQIAE
ncbi:hypothetical protein CRUP_017318, partial [Coryphaenoides rupestris]